MVNFVRGTDYFYSSPQKRRWLGMKAEGRREKFRLRESGNLAKKGRYVIRRLVRNVCRQA